MCRLAAYLGPSVPLSTLLSDPPHSIGIQSYAPLEMVYGTVNVDGTGVAWWPDGEDEPLRYITDRPPWSDPNLPVLAPRLTGRMQIAAVRSAAPGIPYGVAPVAPFILGHLACAHNGYVSRWRETTGREMVMRLPPHLYARYDTASDSLAVFLTAVWHYQEHPEAGLAVAVRQAVVDAIEIAEAAGAQATLNVVVGDGERIVATRVARGVKENNPLYVAQGAQRWPSAVLVASEPLDDDEAWERVADDQLLDITPDGVKAETIVV